MRSPQRPSGCRALALCLALFFCCGGLSSCGGRKSASDSDSKSTKNTDDDSADDDRTDDDRTDDDRTDDDRTDDDRTDDDSDSDGTRPGDNTVCYDVLDELYTCFGDARLSDAAQERLENIAGNCAQATTFTEDEAECMDCMIDVFTECDPRRYQVRTRVELCPTCEHWGSDVAGNLPVSPEPRLCERPETEVCDGQDNDCDGVVDDHFVCPDDAVHDPQPLDGRVYIQVDISSTCGGNVYPAWPESGERVDDINCPKGIRFGGDEKLYYGGNGLFYNDLEARTYVEVPTPMPGCSFSSITDFFSVDASGAVYYTCPNGGPLYRDGVDIRPVGYDSFVGALADGRFITLSQSDALYDFGVPEHFALDYVLYDPDGKELARASPHTEFDSSVMKPVPRVGAIQGNSAAVVFVHDRREDPEMLIYALTPDEEFVLVRRRPTDVTHDDDNSLALPDGSYFLPEGDSLWREAPDGQREVVWTYDPPTAQEYEIHEILAGP